MKLADYRKISAAVNADVAAALLKHGLVAKPLRVSIDERLGLVVIKAECADANHKGSDGSTTNPERELFKRDSMFVGLKPEMLDRTFTISGKEYRVAGLKPRGKKCILVERTSDKAMLVCEPEAVQRAFAFAEMTEASRLAMPSREVAR